MFKSTKPDRRRLYVVSIVFAIALSIFCICMSNLTPSSEPLLEGLPADASPPISKLSVRPTWSFSTHAPPFCRALLQDPQRHGGRPNCWRSSALDCDEKHSVFGQYAQVEYLVREHFSGLKRRGTYVDIASNDVQRVSNTFFADKCLGWDGLCVEPNPVYHKALRTQRSCKLVPRCVSETNGERVKFVFAGPLGGVVDTNRHLVSNNGRLTPDRVQGHAMIRCERAEKLLGEAEVRHVDLLSLDVEGHELPVLRSLDFAKTRINVILIEVTNATMPTIESFLADKNFSRHYVPDGANAHVTDGYLFDDAIFVHKEVRWGYPQ